MLANYRYIQPTIEAQRLQAEMWQQRYETLSAQAEPTGILDGVARLGSDAVNLAMDTFDILSRPLYAISGIADHLVGEPNRGEAVHSRVLRELLGDTKLGNLVGVEEDPERELFNEILEQAGMEHYSILPESLQKKLWGWDPGIRDVAGLGMDIFLDPLLPVSYGAKGIALMGRAGKIHRVRPEHEAAIRKKYEQHLVDFVRRNVSPNRLPENFDEIVRTGRGEEYAKLIDNAEREWTQSRLRAAQVRGVERPARIREDMRDVAERLQEIVDDDTLRGDQAYARFMDAAEKELSDLGLSGWIRREGFDGKVDKISPRNFKQRLSEISEFYDEIGRASRVRKEMMDAENLVSTIQDRLWNLSEREFVREMGEVGLDEASRKAYGLKYAGKVLVDHQTIVGMKDAASRALATAMNQTKPTRWLYQTSSKVGGRAADVLDYMFNRDNRFLRRLPAARQTIQVYRDRREALIRSMQREVEAIFGTTDTNTEQWHLLTRAIDDPDNYEQAWLQTAEELFPEDPDRGKTLLNTLRQYMSRVEDLDIMSGVGNKAAFDQFRGRYMPHMSRGDRIEWMQEYEHLLPQPLREGMLRPSVDGHLEARRFKTIDEYNAARDGAVEFLESQNRLSEAARIREADLVLDPQELLFRRMTASLEAHNTHMLFRELKHRYAATTVGDTYRAIHASLSPVWREDAVEKWVRAKVGNDKQALEKAQKIMDKLVHEGKTPPESMLKQLPSGLQALIASNALIRSMERFSFLGSKDARTASVRRVNQAMEWAINNLTEVNYDDFAEVRRLLHREMSYETGPSGQLWVPTKLGKEEFYLPEGIARQVRQMAEKKDKYVPRELRPLLRGYDVATNLFKEWVTAPFPSFHFRNSYSNVAATFLAIGIRALDPAAHYEALKIMLRNHPRFRDKFADGTLIGRNNVRYTYEQVDRLMDGHNIDTSFSKLAETIPARELERQRASKLKRYSPVGIGGKVGAKVESEARAMLFMHYLKEGHHPADAGRLMKNFLFDYDDLSPFERDVLRRLIPFYTWNSKNIRRQAMNLIENPGRMSVSTTHLAHERGSEEDMLPEYRRGELKARISTGPNGEITYIHNIDLPPQATQMLYDTGLSNTLLGNISIINPLIKAPLELAFDKEAFTGRQISGRQFQGTMGNVIKTLDKATGGFFETEEVELADGTMGVKANGFKVYLWTKTWALGRFLSEAKKFDQMIGNREWAEGLLQIGTGFDIEEYSLEEQAINRFRNNYRRLNDKMVKEGWLNKFETTVPTDRLREAQQQSEEAPR